jgi:hypothetical protein
MVMSQIKPQQLHFQEDWARVTWLWRYLGDSFVIHGSSGRFPVSKGTTTAVEEFRSWHAMALWRAQWMQWYLGVAVAVIEIDVELLMLCIYLQPVEVARWATRDFSDNRNYDARAKCCACRSRCILIILIVNTESEVFLCDPLTFAFLLDECGIW